jgi:hypothetical protein
VQVLELFLHLTVPGNLGVETEIAKGGFHIRSGLDLQQISSPCLPCRHARPASELSCPSPGLR